jgi:L-alanine-DL-glutamate epimerase-like enolase superfamily enzyme
MAPHPQRLTVTHRAWPLAGGGAADAAVVEIADGDSRGRGECVPVPRFGESIASVVAAIEAMKTSVTGGLDRDGLQKAMPPGAARNAIDCAFWAIDANRAYRSVADMAGIGAVKPVITAFTIGLDTPESMAAVAAANRMRPLLRLELGGDGDLDRVRAVRQAAPAARLIVDAAEQWNVGQLREHAPALADCRVELIEQPLPAGDDGALAEWACPVPLCADESCRTRADLDQLVGRYRWVNIKLDKVGGLTEALAIAADAARLGLLVMVGGGTGTSLGVAPALLVAQGAGIVDLDGPLRLAMDRGSALRFEGSTIHPAEPALWGGPG